MNIRHLIEAEQSLNEAMIATINPQQREVIFRLGVEVRNLLALNGVFVAGLEISSGQSRNQVCPPQETHEDQTKTNEA